MLFFSSILQENQELLLKSISEDIGFSEGKPVAACLIYKCLIHWRSFEVERTNIFNRIIETIASAIEVVSMFFCTNANVMGGHGLMLCFTFLQMQENDDVLCYWLSNSATLLMLLERTLKAGNIPPSRHRAMSTSLFGRVSQVVRSVYVSVLNCFNSINLTFLSWNYVHNRVS